MARRACGWVAVACAALGACGGVTRLDPTGSTSSSSSATSTGSSSASTTAVGPGCATSGRVQCNLASAQQITPGPAVTMVHAPGPIPEAFGGAVTPGNYVLTRVTLYGTATPNNIVTEPGAMETATLSVSCDQYNEVYESVTSNGSGTAETCGRLVPTERPLGSIFQSNDSTVDGTPYNATADTIDLIDIEPFASGPYVLDEYAIVAHFTLVVNGSTPPPEPLDASAPPPPTGVRDPRCPATAPATGAPCDPSLGPLECEYGGDADGRCTTLAACSLTPPASTFAYAVTTSTDCGRTNDPSCPASLDAAEALPPLGPPGDGGVDPRCEPDGGVAPAVTCNYPGGSCACVGAGATVACSCLTGADVASPTGGPCPAQRPLAGDGCTAEGAWCIYSPPCGSASLGPSMMCVDGHWIQYAQFAGCPAFACVAPAGH